MVTPSTPLPLSQRSAADLPGHWLLARMGKRVLRPGGARLTSHMLAHARLGGADVVELAPGLGRTASEILQSDPRHYTGVDRDLDAVKLVKAIVADRGDVIQADAERTGLPDNSADVVIGEAMLSMQTHPAKEQIVQEAVRLLRPGGRYAIHELAVQPDDIDHEFGVDIRKDLARAIKVNARPLTVAEWKKLLASAGLTVDWVETAPMALLQMRRNFADEGFARTLRIAKNVLSDKEARTRILAMRATFQRHRDHLLGVALVAHRPDQTSEEPA